jgi:hypothetical protein
MTEAPEKIWAYAGSFKMWRDHKTDQPHEQTQYTRSDIADTLRNERDAHRSDSWALGVIRSQLTDKIDTLQAEVARLREALEHSKTGWENVVELELLDPAHDFTASGLLYEARTALAHGEDK